MVFNYRVSSALFFSKTRTNQVLFVRRGPEPSFRQSRSDNWFLLKRRLGNPATRDTLNLHLRMVQYCQDVLLDVWLLASLTCVRADRLRLFGLQRGK